MLTFPSPRAPEVSVVMPLHGRWEWTVRALGALLANTEPIYELIAVDNASPDGTADRLESTCVNIRLVRNERNVGFGIACNQGEANARSPLVVFLNSDALVHAGWLGPLIETAGRRSVGAVGPRFLNLDGSIQEAGAVLFRDALTAPYGTTEEARADVDRPRPVDYVSAACLLARRTAFAQVGGFDAVYAPAYFEDLDLCLALADHGYRTLYEPRSRVTHAFGWSPPDQELASRNRPAFARRWTITLAARPPSAMPLAWARDAPLVDRILVVAGRSADAHDHAALLARRVADLCGAAYVAIIGPTFDPTEQKQLLGSGVAVVDASEGLDDWLTTYRFHFDVVLGTHDLDEALTRRLEVAQPQADWIAGAGLSVTTLEDALLEHGVDVGLDRSAGDGVDDV